MLILKYDKDKTVKDTRRHRVQEARGWSRSPVRCRRLSSHGPLSTTAHELSTIYLPFSFFVSGSPPFALMFLLLTSTVSTVLLSLRLFPSTVVFFYKLLLLMQYTILIIKRRQFAEIKAIEASSMPGK